MAQNNLLFEFSGSSKASKSMVLYPNMPYLYRASANNSHIDYELKFLMADWG